MKTIPRSSKICAQTTSSMRGFTLIELLTVIAIIGILAAIIIPTVNKVRSTARKAECVSRLRQWGTAVRLFANDSKGMIALYNKSGTDQLLYSQYFGQLYMVDGYGNRVMAQVALAQCPISVAAKLPTTDTNYRARDYAFLKPVGTTKKILGSSIGLPLEPGIDAYNLSDAATPSRLILMSEVFAPTNDHFVIDCSSGASALQSPVQAMQVNANTSLIRHSGSANILWLDGHVNTLSSSDTMFTNPANKTLMTSWVTLR